jgi:RimJ/RimL family protein N-acetyltransferase
MRLRELQYNDIDAINEWRNTSKVGLRTNGPETILKQEDFFAQLDKRTDLRFWAVEIDKITDAIFSNDTYVPTLIGQGGFTDISLDNLNAEISLIIDPRQRGKGFGKEAVDLLLEQAFDYMNLQNVYGEVYDCNDVGVLFWQKVVDKYGTYFIRLPSRKYWEGKYYDSLYFNLNRYWYVMKKEEKNNGKV